MATSNVYGYSTSRNFIITEAFRKIGALGDGETIDNTRLSIGAGVLNPMVKTFSAYGLNVWTLDKITIPFSEWTTPVLNVGPAGDFEIDYKPLKLLEAYRNDGTTDVPIGVYSNKEYFGQPNKTTTGTPTMVYYQPLAYDGNIYLWQPPNTHWQTTGSFIGIFQRQLQDFDTGTDEPDFPSEWHEALIYQLAVRLAPNYGLAPTDRQMLKKDADDILELVKSFDQEQASLFIQPNARRVR